MESVVAIRPGAVTRGNSTHSQPGSPRQVATPHPSSPAVLQLAAVSKLSARRNRSSSASLISTGCTFVCPASSRGNRQPKPTSLTAAQTSASLGVVGLRSCRPPPSWHVRCYATAQGVHVHQRANRLGPTTTTTNSAHDVRSRDSSSSRSPIPAVYRARFQPMGGVSCDFPPLVAQHFRPMRQSRATSTGFGWCGARRPAGHVNGRVHSAIRLQAAKASPSTTRSYTMLARQLRAQKRSLSKAAAALPRASSAMHARFLSAPVITEDHEEDEVAMSGGEPTGSEHDTLDTYLTTLKKYNPPIKTGLKGLNIVHDPLYNKGTGFPHVERDRLGTASMLSGQFAGQTTLTHLGCVKSLQACAVWCRRAASRWRRSWPSCTRPSRRRRTRSARAASSRTCTTVTRRSSSVF
jgi:hypothetical protein